MDQGTGKHTGQASLALLHINKKKTPGCLLIPNGKNVKKPDRTIDYIFYENLEKGTYRVRMEDTLKISDHLPLTVTFKIQAAN